MLDLLERDTQRAAFRSATGRVVLVTGEAGSGKTSLVRSALATCADRPTIRVNRDSMRTARPWGSALV